MIIVTSRFHRKLYEGFTLIELLVTIGILAVLAVAVILVLNPSELLKQGRDSTRLSDMASLHSALSLLQTDTGGTLPMGSSSVVYISISDPNATSTQGTDCSSLGLSSLPSGWSYHCASSSTLSNVNGQGWVPLNFTRFSTGSPPGTAPYRPRR